MPHEISTTKTIPSALEENSQELSILFQKVLGTDNTLDFTEKQVDELLSQKREMSGFVHRDKMRESEDARFYLVAVVIFVLALSGMVLWKDPNSFDEVLDFLAGLLGGGLGGYGLGVRKRA